MDFEKIVRELNRDDYLRVLRELIDEAPEEKVAELVLYLISEDVMPTEKVKAVAMELVAEDIARLRRKSRRA